MRMKKIGVLIVVLMALFLQGCGSSSADSVNETSDDTQKSALTIMYYGDADNNLEPYLLQDVAEMKAGYSDAGYNLITLFDRIGSSVGSSDSTDSAVFGEDFTDTRLYRIGKNATTRLNGGTQLPTITASGASGELNMGDAATLKKFIQYCKANYPAEKYVLIMSNHGGGARSVKSTSSSKGNVKAICWDDTDGDDALYTGEISDTLTSSESVDVMALDACLMGSVEFAYQFRNDSSNTGFKSDYMVASPALVWGYGLPYDSILARLSSSAGNNGTANTLGGGTEAYIVPSSTMNMAEFSKMIVEEQYDDTISETSETFSAYDLSKVTALKTAIDDFAKTAVQATLEGVRGTTFNTNTAMNYMSSNSDWSSVPFFDIYDLMRKYNSTESSAVLTALDDVILTSFGGTDFYNANDSTGFTKNKNGMHIVFPKLYSSGTTYSLANIYWYTPVNINTYLATYGYDFLYGKLTFCSGGTEGNATVESWFEMVDKWYDNTSFGTKGYNGYNY